MLATDAGSRDAQADGWHAALELEFLHRSGRTRLRRGKGHGPLYVQKPFYPEDDVCHVYLLHPPGGVAGGDRLELALRVSSGAHALLTIPAATKYYRTAGAAADVRQTFEVEAGGRLEWLPLESLYFGGARVQVATDVILHPGSAYLGWEVNCLGRPASGDAFQSGSLDLRTTLRRPAPAGAPAPFPGATLYNDRCRLHAGDDLVDGRWGLQGRPVFATLYAYPVDQDRLDLVLDAWPSRTDPAEASLTAVTSVNGVLIARASTAHAEAALRWLRALWATVRPLVLNKPACPPRIWQT